MVKKRTRLRGGVTFPLQKDEVRPETCFRLLFVWSGFVLGGFQCHSSTECRRKVNKLQGELIGDTSMKNCTTIFNNVSERDTGTYYFRIEGRMKFTYFQFPLPIKITASLPKPTLTLYGEQMEEQNQRKQVFERKSVSLFCSAFLSPTFHPPTLTWSPLQNNSSQEQNQNSSFVSSHLNFTVTRLHHGLSINCTATYQLKNQEIKTENSLILRVLYAPGNISISVSPSGPVMLGSSVSLSCSSDGNPAVNYTWFRENGEQIETGPTFSITETNDTHSGLYYCRAQNQHGSQNSSVQLDVQYAPKNTSVSVSPSRPVMLGSSVSLSCSSDGNPAVNYTWFRENGSKIETGPTVNITETNETHSGFCYCRAQNQHGSQNSSVQLDVQYASRNTSISVPPSCSVMWGSSLSLSCSSEGNPAVNYTWFRENGEQIETRPTFIITEVNDTHNGLYNCRAQNQHGFQNTPVQLDVQYAPRNTSVSVSPSGSVMWGSSVSLSCSSDGNPAVSYTWIRENGEQIETGPTFNITETNDTYSGLYYCRAQNQHGSQNSSVQLEVQFSPQFLTSSHCKSSDNDTAMMICLCEVRGRPVPKLEWHLNGQPVSQSGNFSIKNESVGVSGLKSILSVHQSHLSMSSPHLQCVSTSQLGSSTLVFNFVGRCSNSAETPGPKGYVSPQSDYLHVSSLLIGLAIGACAVMMLCGMYIFRRRKPHRPSPEDNAGLLLNERVEGDNVDTLYSNKTILSAGRTLNPDQRNSDSLHYSTISFPNGQNGSGVILGLSQLTPDYATIRHSSGDQTETEMPQNSAPADVSGQPSREEEATYGNIVRQETVHFDTSTDQETSDTNSWQETSETIPTEELDPSL
ncbi:carcinoembryonic antigen-related cell adhesion molecule 5-like isoform X2 [Hoplias malabaricus]|uniref:carcinoembryonic antigen-related cell adhesion molecule 5-like isoform X2 n=1 Tax=Hoplias malabaricus TaxID=27720 RepID=UPI003461B54D